MAGVVIQKAKERSSCDVEEELTWTQNHYSETTLSVELGQGLLDGDSQGDDLRVKITMTGHRSSFPSFMTSNTCKVVEDPQDVEPNALDWNDDDSEASTAASSSKLSMNVKISQGGSWQFKKVKKQQVLTVELLRHCGSFAPCKTLGSAEVAMDTLPKECFLDGNGSPSGSEGKIVCQRVRLGNAGLFVVGMKFETRSVLKTKEDWDMVIAEGPP